MDRITAGHAAAPQGMSEEARQRIPIIAFRPIRVDPGAAPVAYQSVV
jgi:hypothetical protein